MAVSDRLVNLLGVLAVGVTDRMRSAVAEAMPEGGETVPSLIVIGHAPMMSIDQLSRILRLTHGGAVRLVDRLVERNLVDKQPSAIDRRIMTLTLTPSGLQLREELLALRRDALAALLERVSPDDLAPLGRIAAIIVASLPENALSALTTCRYCDDRICIDCPMEVFGPLETPGSSTATV
ncbi:MarR family winged helix-turn-helix transcriptional regulator [Sinorhizobium mexicanum]|uniref:MarR family transcriptional regulator n=1 Tax=Sinorhizobium mexicanum TaxID=375549 RepID=A0A859QX22_9HYPH|nr:MarR family transcriptional regulator [Sinorhizobium mexicanum]MBP1888284.1 DNA-binding MarR family transcriptional regulator [Sinorhizobium mexicanum]QLL64079.1 MarR family transcriptional regulator [Sinorhizobium mexicanum]